MHVLATELLWRVVQDYFEFQSGVGARGLTPENAQAIKKWLKDNP